MTVLPLYNVMLIPETNLYLQTQAFTAMTGKEPENQERLIIAAEKSPKKREEITEDDLYPIGVSGIITEINSDNGYIVIRTKKRADITDVTIFADHTINVTATRREDTPDEEVSPDEERARLDKMKQALVGYFANSQYGNLSRGYIAQFNSISEVAAAMSPWLFNSAEDRYKVLEEDSKVKRLELMEKMIYENIEMSNIGAEAANAQEADYQKIYRESALKKQIDYLQKELDDMHPENVSDIRKFEIALKDNGMNEDAKKEAEKVLGRLKQEGKNSPEYGMLYDYLDFVTTLSWKKEEPKDIDLKQARAILDEDHFGLKKVKDRIIQQIAVMNLKKQQAGSILLFVGAPGTGKTSIGKSIARALGRKYVRVALGGVRDEAEIRGHRRTYIGAMPGRIMDGIHKSGVSNPVMVLDEIDKLSESYNGDPASALLEVLDPEQNNSFTDHYMNVPYDLSDVLFICTANTLDTIPAPLLNRMEVIEFQGYTPIEKEHIAKDHLIPKAFEKAGIPKDKLSIDDDALETIISDYTMEGGVRGLKKRIDTLCRIAAVKIESGESSVTVHKDELRDYLDMHPLHQDKVKEEGKPGIITGLAWTQVGGTILYIESLMTKGTGKLTITGQLGDVMKESATIALSLVKAMYPSKIKLLEKSDIHIHVPDGSTPKDGPSAGITLTTALSSLVTGTAVTPQVAMTGEVSLNGSVNPIGGLPEKLMAAQRAGVKHVFIPEENMDDLRDVADEVKSALEITPVKQVTDVLDALNIPVENPSLQNNK
ncbi:MAG: endopeptidase La [Lachnospiraceae bacterium]|nr:endopeptidase La [Lachnospiraceae bacterium]MDD7665397.1 endopeptidase La [Lachnospiraceae bacterium]MDY4165716.1 endopeptidase La [Lachnospiraceae bacterium]